MATGGRRVFVTGMGLVSPHGNDPDEVFQQCKRWEQAGADQLSFGLPVGVPKEETLQTIRLIGEHVIPKIDTDPVHRTSRFRAAA